MCLTSEVIAISSEVIPILSEVIAINSENFRRKGHFFRNLSFDKKKIKKKYKRKGIYIGDTRVHTHARENFIFF